MTIEEFIAQELGGNPNEIVFLGFEASPSHVWSEWTSDSFSCIVHFDRRNEPARSNGREYWTLYLGEEDVCDMLNKLFPVKEVK